MPDLSTLYVNRPVKNAADIIAWAKSQGFQTTLLPEDMHVTVAFSRKPVDWLQLDEDDSVVTIPPTVGEERSLSQFGEATVLQFESPVLTSRWLQFVNSGASWDHDDYHPHITISWEMQGFDLSSVVPYRGPIVLGPEAFAPIKEDWKENIVEKVSTTFEQWQDAMASLEKIGARNSKTDQEKLNAAHDALVAAGAHCPSHMVEGSGDRLEKIDVRDIRKMDDSLGLVFGYAMVCKVNGEDYYDLNVDLHTMKRVPEHIPEGAMLTAATEFMENGGSANVMHSGPVIGKYLFVFPLTTDIAKAMGMSTNTTGLMIGWKPPPDIYAKFKSGELKGFSIEGRRISVREHE